MTYNNELIVRGSLHDKNVEKEILSTISRLKNTYGPQCVSIELSEIQIFSDGKYKRGYICNNSFCATEETYLQYENSVKESNFWVAKITVCVNDLTLHNKLKKVQHGDDNVFTSQS